jgi:non-heme chloroperoxidase
MFRRRAVHSVAPVRAGPTEWSAPGQQEDTMAIPAAVAEIRVRTHQVSGGGGVRLHVEETGNRSGQPVLFIHGLSQSALAWQRQLSSELARDHRLVAFDLRGHGDSERPADGYGDSGLWAEDVAAVITALDLERPILTGWSYGGVVICDYLSRYGEDRVGGIHLVAAICRLGEPVLPFLGPKFLAVIPDLFATDAEQSMTALRTFGRLLTREPLAAEDSYRFLGAAATTPPRVRQGLLDRTLDYDGLLAGLSRPALITHGIEDEVVLPSMGEHMASIVRPAQTSYYSGIGHAPFWEDPDRFNAELRTFAASL